jgi:signal transduction histidine kinase
MDVAQLIEDALLVVRPRAIQQETTVNVTIDQGLPKIRGDQKQLGEALLNLLVNALEAMPHGGRLLVAASLAQFSPSSAPLTGIRIDISDTGPGIAPEDIPRLFDPFFTTKASGTGLGLSIVRSTVQGHGGEVRVESRADAGTTFSIFLPLGDAQDRDAHGKDPDR